MRTLARLFVGTVIALGLLVPPAGAITYGTPDGDGHPYVGIVRLFDADGAYLWRCSGTLLSSTVFLTAGHCAGTDDTDPDDVQTPARAAVWFTPTAPATPEDQSLWTFEYFTTQVDPPASLGTPVPHPDYESFRGFPDTHDIGIVVLDTPVVMDTYGTLPPEGFLDQYATQRGLREIWFTTVGYGVQQIRPQDITLTVRYVSTSSLVNLRSFNAAGFSMQTTNNPGGGRDARIGGSCFGDSGGPVFYEDTTIIVGIVSYGLSPNCTGNNDFSFRVDTEESLSFVDQYL